jgi:hypothetical protein
MTSIFKFKTAQLLKAQGFACALLCGCQTDLRSPNHGLELEYPAREDFALVSDAMQLRCGTLDCHGQIGRNMRLFGRFGLRLADTDSPFEPLTTEAEYEASYWSVVALEPEAMTRVVRGDESPIQLAFVRKPRGLEKHKGLQLMSKGDPLDRCLVGWATAAADPDACTEAIQTPRPEPDGGK